jgi:hypothetical protein
MYQEEESTQVRRRQAAKAIQLALSSRWEEAAEINKSIISLFPNDVDSYNRLGKALMELGRYNEAKKAYKKALDLDTTNQIARKNLDRLAVLVKAGAAQIETSLVDPTLFIEEMGKSAVTVLRGMPAEAFARLNAGDKLEMRPDGKALSIETPSGEFVGTVEPKLGLRLLKLMDGGNEYTAAVTSLSADQCRIIIKETHQDPSQIGRPSFPAATTGEGTRPYTKGSLLRYGTPSDDAEEVEESDEAEVLSNGRGKDAWENETEVQEGDVRLYDAVAAEEAAEDDIEE